MTSRCGNLSTCRVCIVSYMYLTFLKGVRRKEGLGFVLVCGSSPFWKPQLLLIESYAYNTLPRNTHPEDLGEGFSVDVVLEGGAGANQRPPNSCWQGGGAGTQSFCVSLSLATPHSCSVPGVCRITSSPSPPPVLAKPANHPEGGKNNKLLEIVKKYHRKIVIIHRESYGSPPITVLPPTFCCALPFRFLRALPHPSYLHPSHPLDLPAEKTALSSLPCHGGLVHRLLCPSTNQIYKRNTEKQPRSGIERERERR